MNKGLFITFEGADGCGKSTQLRWLNEYLKEKGYEVVCTREPGGCPLAESVREMLLSRANTGMTARCEALLFAAARAEHIDKTIRPALRAGKIVLCDRFFDSSMAYQAYGRELGEDFVRQINQAVTECMPDRTYLFGGKQEEIALRLAARGDSDRIEAENAAFVRRLYDGVEALARQEPRRIRRINAGRKIPVIAAEVAADAEELLSNS